MGIVCCRCPTSLTLLSLLIFPLSSQSFIVKSSRQYLPPIPGYVPVYIQDGDIPPDVESIVKEQQTLNDSETSKDVEDNDKIEAAARNVDDALKESEVKIVQQLTRGPQQTVQHARLFYNLPSFKQNKKYYDTISHFSNQENHFIAENPS